MITRDWTAQAKIGVFGIGLARTGRSSRAEGAARGLPAPGGSAPGGMGGEVISAGLVDTAPAAQAAGDLFAREDVDLIVCYVGTYATSSQVLPAVQRGKAPVLILNLQPAPALDYPNTDTGEWLAHCAPAACRRSPTPSPAAASSSTWSPACCNPAEGHAGRYFDRAWGEIDDWVAAAGHTCANSAAAASASSATPTPACSTCTPTSPCTTPSSARTSRCWRWTTCTRACPGRPTQRSTPRSPRSTASSTSPSRARTRSRMPVTDEGLRWSARVAVGLDRLAADFDLNGLTYYYRGLDGNAERGARRGRDRRQLAADRARHPGLGEGDLKTCVAMLMMDRLGAGGSYTEFYAMDFDEDFILMGHDGPGHLAISDGKPVLRGLGLYHGKRGYGLSVEFNVKTGPITILGMTQTADGRLKLLAAEGESIPGPRLEIGNTNSRLKFGLDPAEFMNRWSEQGPTHHCALGVGHQLGKIRKLAPPARSRTGGGGRIAGPHAPAGAVHRGKSHEISPSTPP